MFGTFEVSAALWCGWGHCELPLGSVIFVVYTQMDAVPGINLGFFIIASMRQLLWFQGHI